MALPCPHKHRLYGLIAHDMLPMQYPLICMGARQSHCPYRFVHSFNSRLRYA
jgi:hypothetical protein